MSRTRILTVLGVLICLAWIPFALRLTYRHVAFAVRVFDLGFGRSEAYKRWLVNADIHEAIETIRKGTPERAKVLVVARDLPMDFRFAYYLYPRTIIVKAPDDLEDIRRFCREEGIHYWIVHVVGDTPYLGRVE